MNAEKRFNSYVISITTAFMFSIWLLVSNLIVESKSIAIFLGALISLGTYRASYLILHSLFYRWKWLKKHILGPCYLEGIWVGFFIASNGNQRYFIEHFDQDLNSLVIRGKSFDEKGKFHGFWTSDTTYINVKKGKLTYYYEADIMRNTFINPGLAAFEFNRESVCSPPFSLIGFSSDLFNPQKLKAYEERVNDKIENNIEKIVETAREIHIRNRQYV